MELMKSALDSCIVSVLVTDNRLPDNPIIYCNDAFERITGYTQEEIIGLNCRFLQGDNPDFDKVAYIKNAVTKGEGVTSKIMNFKKDGTPFWNELHISPIKDCSGNTTHFIGIQIDVTDRKMLEAFDTLQVPGKFNSIKSFVESLKLLLPEF